jgi:predicted small integral membrane protein
MLRIMKILLVLSVALWGILGAYGNLTDWSGTTGAVKAVTSMSAFDGGADKWQATSNPMIVTLGALFIMLSKIIAGLLCVEGARRMWGARAGDAAEFAKAKTLALTGCAVAVFMLFLGFIVIAEGWYALWQSDAMRGPVLSSAFRYAGMITLIAIFVGMGED